MDIHALPLRCPGGQRIRHLRIRRCRLQLRLIIIKRSMRPTDRHTLVVLSGIGSFLIIDSSNFGLPWRTWIGNFVASSFVFCATSSLYRLRLGHVRHVNRDLGLDDFSGFYQSCAFQVIAVVESCLDGNVKEGAGNLGQIVKTISRYQLVD